MSTAKIFKSQRYFLWLYLVFSQSPSLFPWNSLAFVQCVQCTLLYGCMREASLKHGIQFLYVVAVVKAVQMCWIFSSRPAIVRQTTEHRITICKTMYNNINDCNIPHTHTHTFTYPHIDRMKRLAKLC